MFYKLKTT